jgi:hypothetical protein
LRLRTAYAKLARPTDWLAQRSWAALKSTCLGSGVTFAELLQCES